MNAPGENDSLRPGRWPVVLVAAVAIATFALGVVGPLLGEDWPFGFIYDDHRFVERNESIRSLDLWTFVTDPRTVDEADDWKGIYRPLRTFSFAIDHAIWGLRPVGYHLQNLLWHAFASVCLLLLLVRIGADRAPATLAALVFAVHPVQAESVMWITSRGDVMSGALVLAALAVHAGRMRSALLHGLVVAGLGLLAMLAKEVAIGLPVAIVLLDVLVRRPWVGKTTETRVTRHAITAWLPTFVMAAGYLILRQHYMGKFDDVGGHLESWWGGSWGGQLVVAARGFLLHVSSVFFPVGARLDYYPPTHGTIDLGSAIGMLALATTLAGVALTWRRLPIVATGLLVFLLFLFPTSSVLVTVGIPSADRFLYLPLAGIAMALTPLARRVPLAAAAVVLLALIAVPESTKYASDDALWENAPPGSPRALIDGARREYDEVARLWDSGETEEARALIPHAIASCQAALDRWAAISGSDGVAPLFYTHIRLSDLHRLHGERWESFASLKRAEFVRPDNPKLPYQRSWLLRDIGDPGAALTDLLKARDSGFRDDLREEIARLLNDLALRESQAGSAGWAVLHLQRSLEEWPAEAGNDAGKALGLLREEIRLNLSGPDPAEGDLEGWLARGQLLGQCGRWPSARSILLGLRRVAPRSVPLLVTLARWGFEEAGMVEEAAKLYAQAASIDPRNVDALTGLVRCDGFWLDSLLRADTKARLEMLDRLPDDDARVLVLRARAYRELGRHVTTRSLLETASKMQGPGVLSALEELWTDHQRDR